MKKAGPDGKKVTNFVVWASVAVRGFVSVWLWLKYEAQMPWAGSNVRGLIAVTGPKQKRNSWLGVCLALAWRWLDVGLVVAWLWPGFAVALAWLWLGVGFAWLCLGFGLALA